MVTRTNWFYKVKDFMILNEIDIKDFKDGREFMTRLIVRMMIRKHNYNFIVSGKQQRSNILQLLIDDESEEQYINEAFPVETRIVNKESFIKIMEEESRIMSNYENENYKHPGCKTWVDEENNKLDSN